MNYSMEMNFLELFLVVTLTLGISQLIYQIYLRIKNSFFSQQNPINSPTKSVYLHGISSSFPSNCYQQNEMHKMFIENYCGGEKNLIKEDKDFIDRVFVASSIDQCYVNLSEKDLFQRMKREQYTQYVKSTMLTMACQAATNALNNSNGLQIHQITHLVFGTMTGTICAPSMDIHLVKELGLNSNVKRLNVESMGCLTGFRLVGLCRDLSLESEYNYILLIVCDIRSALGNQLTPFLSMESIDKSNVIIAALFRDACGAAIFSSQKSSKNLCQIIDHRCAIIPQTFELGRLKELNDSSIHLYLDKQLPYAVFDYLPNLIEELLQEYQIDIQYCQFAVHTGGPKILRGVQKCLNLLEEQLCASWYVMINYGNLSGSSNLVVLEHFLRWRQNSSLKPICQKIRFPSDWHFYQYVIGLSFGPGIALECVLFHLQ